MTLAMAGFFLAGVSVGYLARALLVWHRERRRLRAMTAYAADVMANMEAMADDCRRKWKREGRLS